MYVVLSWLASLLFISASSCVRFCLQMVWTFAFLLLVIRKPTKSKHANLFVSLWVFIVTGVCCNVSACVFACCVRYMWTWRHVLQLNFLFPCFACIWWVAGVLSAQHHCLLLVCVSRHLHPWQGGDLSVGVDFIKLLLLSLDLLFVCHNLCPQEVICVSGCLMGSLSCICFVGCFLHSQCSCW